MGDPLRGDRSDCGNEEAWTDEPVDERVAVFVVVQRAWNGRRHDLYP